MSTPILATKLYLPPARPKAVARPRLIQRMNEGLHRKLTLISAPAGFGKSTLASEWATACGRPVGWLLLDAGDNDPARFLAYLVAALQMVTAETGPATFGTEVLGLLQTPQPPSIETVMTALLNEITAIPDKFILVLDDYHVIDTKPANDALTFLLKHLPPHMHLVITTREDPNLPLARLRVRGKLTELRAADLRFTPAEAATFLNQGMGLNLTEKDISALDLRTEGWIAGLQLAALSMQGRANTADFIRSFTGSHRFVMDYLVEEVLHQQSEPVQTFLLCTSILDRLCGPLCDAVLGPDLASSASGQETLERIEQANLFLIPLDNQRRWYRYHHLFGDLLRQRLSQRAVPENPESSVATLHIRASQWFEENGEPGDAVRHALVAEDYERAAAVAEVAWRSMDRQYQSGTWLGWVKALPDKLVWARPVLSAEYAWALLDSGEMEAAEVRLQDAERWLELDAQSPDSAGEMVVASEAEFRALPTTIANARAYLAQALGDVPGTIKYARRALELPFDDDYFGRGLSALLLGFAHWTSGDLALARQAVSDAVSDMWTVGNIPFAISFTSYLADIILAQGYLHEAISVYEHALQQTREQREDELAETAVLHLGLSELYHELDDMKAATSHLRRSEEMGEQIAFPPWYRHWARAQARIKITQGDLDGAVEILNEARRLYFRHPVPDTRPIAALRARVWILQGNLQDALAWAHAQGLSADDELSYLREFEHITLARILMAQNQNGPAVALLERLLQAAESGERTGSVIEILVALALAHQSQKDIPAALAALARALNLAEPEGYVRIFVGQGDPIRMLLEEAAAASISPVYVGRLRAAFGEPEVSSPVNQPSNQPLIEPLSDRELDVLKRLVSELSGPEIAETLMISLNTLRTHTKNIYSKLSVNSRRAAVSQAKELGLL